MCRGIDKSLVFVTELDDSSQKDRALNLLNAMQNMLNSNEEYKRIGDDVSIHTVLFEEDTILVEMATMKRRANFFIDNDIDDSCVILLDSARDQTTPLLTELKFDEFDTLSLVVFVFEFFLKRDMNE